MTYIFSKRLIRSAVAGWVSNKWLKLCRLIGSSIYKDVLALLAACMGGLFSILVKALIKPCGFRVSSTELASARYSRFLDRAIWARLAA